MTNDMNTDFETLYKAAVNSAELHVASRSSANSVIERLLSSRNDVTASDLTRRIQEAASQGDTDLIFQLTDELRKAKSAESDRNARLLKMADEFSFLEVLRAYQADFKDLTYELGLLVLQKTQEGLSKKRPTRLRDGAPPKGTVYLISHEGETIEAMKNPGAAKLPGHEREFFEFFGFDISEDGRMLEPPAFVNAQGQTVSANSKRAIIDDLIAGNKRWTDRGYRIRIKEETVTS